MERVARQLRVPVAIASAGSTRAAVLLWPCARSPCFLGPPHSVESLVRAGS